MLKVKKNVRDLNNMKTIVLSVSTQRQLAKSAEDFAKNVVSYVPETLTASDNIDLVYESISESWFKKRLKVASITLSGFLLSIISHHFIILV